LSIPENQEPSGSPWVRVARGATLRGPRGLLTARLLEQGVNPFRPGQRLALQRGEEQREFFLQSAEVYRDRVVLQLRGVSSAREAGELVGSDILLQSKDLVDLPEGTYYIFRLVGLAVLRPDGHALGRIVEVVKTGGTDLLRVQGEKGEEWLIPFARSICKRIDPEAGVIEIDPPEGLLDLDAI
jgi:16S rRNA processing protein RimM